MLVPTNPTDGVTLAGRVEDAPKRLLCIKGFDVPHRLFSGLIDPKDAIILKRNEQW